MRGLATLRRVGYLTAKEVAERLRTGVENVYNRIGDGSLRATNIGTERRPKWRVEETELDRFIAARSSAPPETEQ